MIKRICNSKLLASVVLLLALASPSFAGEAETSRLEAFERFTSSPAFEQFLFFLPADSMWSVVEDVEAANTEIRLLVKRLKPVGTRALFQHIGTRKTAGGIPNILTLKQIDMQQMLDWELAVTRDLKEVAVAVNFRF